MTMVQRGYEYDQMDMPDGPREPVEVTKLIRKLRWIGMDEEARHLEDRLKACPSCRRPSVLREPSSTD
jgi:hypothetical protein